MEFNMKQWRKDQHQQESEEDQPSSKIPRQLLLESVHHQPQQTSATAATILPLFVSQPNKFTTHLSDFSYPTPHSTTSPSFSMMKSGISGGGYCFSLAQWQELEVQALIFRHIMAGSAVPPELLHFVKKSLLTSSTSPYYHHNYHSQLQQPFLMQSGHWGKGAIDPEPGRCRRTDGKKWRCSRDVVAGHKYCDRHMHRGRNRSRKPVEIPTSCTGGAGASGGATGGGGGDGGSQFTLTVAGAESLDAFQLHQGTSNTQSEVAKSNKVLMQFFDDWPTSLQESSSANTNAEGNGKTSSNFLRLATGNGDELSRRNGFRKENEERERQHAQLNWATQWGGNHVGSMGGPLAEALRSSTNSSSPTSVLHQLPRCSASDTDFISA